MHTVAAIACEKVGRRRTSNETDDESGLLECFGNALLQCPLEKHLEVVETGAFDDAAEMARTDSTLELREQRPETRADSSWLISVVWIIDDVSVLVARNETRH